MGDVEDFLVHHGIKGMKWGVRKSRPMMNKAQKRKRRIDRTHKAITVAAGALFVAKTVSFLTDSSTPFKPPIDLNKLGGHSPLPKVPPTKLKPGSKLSGKALRDEEARRNGALFIKKMLQNMGEDVL